MKKVSVIIPVYNGAKTLQQCLESVLNQNHNNYELIVVDNNSSDDTKKIIKSFRNKDIKYVFKEKIGRGSAKNAGIIEATGEIIAITDSDCIVPKNWVTELIRPILYENENIVMGSERDIINNYWTKNIQKADYEFNKRNLEKNNHIKLLDTKNFAIKSSLLKKMMFDEKIRALEDFELYLRLKEKHKIRFLPEVRVIHRHRNSFEKYFKMQFERGYWAYRIYKNHRLDERIKEEPVLENISIKNFIIFPLWLISQLFKKPPEEVFFILISEIAWRTGLVRSFLSYH